jgi:hypothetical protein
MYTIRRALLTGTHHKKIRQPKEEDLVAVMLKNYVATRLNH